MNVIEAVFVCLCVWELLRFCLFHKITKSNSATAVVVVVVVVVIAVESQNNENTSNVDSG